MVGVTASHAVVFLEVLESLAHLAALDHVSQSCSLGVFEGAKGRMWIGTRPGNKKLHSFYVDVKRLGIRKYQNIILES